MHISIGNYNSIEYDGIGRVWKRTDDTSAESYYYHTGTKLAQELDDSNGVTVDYMAGSRRYMPNEDPEDRYRYYAKDHLGSVVMMTDRDAATGGLSTEFYTYDSWGEHADTAAVPSTGNSIRYAGGRVEFFADGTAEGAVYLCGERHYMPMYGRFLQRDRLTYESIPPANSPLSVNPYIYAYNNPVMFKDVTGLSPSGYYRGARMPGRGTVILGTYPPPADQMYDCCDKGYRKLDHAETFTSPLYNTKLQGSRPLAWWFRKAGWNVGSGLCAADPSEAQPNPGCPAITTATPDLLCTYMEQCMGLTCPTWSNMQCPLGEGDANTYTFEDPGFLETALGFWKEWMDRRGWTYPWQNSTSNPDPFEQAWATNRPQWIRNFQQWGTVAVGVAVFGILLIYGLAAFAGWEAAGSGSSITLWSYESVLGISVTNIAEVLIAAIGGGIALGLPALFN